MRDRRHGNVTKPTEAELHILRCLWNSGPCTVRALCDALQSEQKWGYTTVLKFLQIMSEKGLVTRQPHGRAHLYAAAIDEDSVQTEFVGDLVKRVFQGSTQKLVLGALASGDVTPQELAEIRAIVENLERERA